MNYIYERKTITILLAIKFGFQIQRARRLAREIEFPGNFEPLRAKLHTYISHSAHIHRIYDDGAVNPRLMSDKLLRACYHQLSLSVCVHIYTRATFIGTDKSAAVSKSAPRCSNKYSYYIYNNLQHCPFLEHTRISSAPKKDALSQFIIHAPKVHILNKHRQRED